MTKGRVKGTESLPENPSPPPKPVVETTPPVAVDVHCLIVTSAYPGTWSVDANGVKVRADTAAEALRIVHDALLGEGT